MRGSRRTLRKVKYDTVHELPVRDESDRGRASASATARPSPAVCIYNSVSQDESPLLAMPPLPGVRLPHGERRQVYNVAGIRRNNSVKKMESALPRLRWHGGRTKRNRANVRLSVYAVRGIGEQIRLDGTARTTDLPRR